LGDVTISESFLEKFTDGLQESAAAQQASAAAMTAVAAELRTLANDQRNGRLEAVEQVKMHIETTVKLSNRWPSILLGLLGVLATVAVGILGLIAARMR